jgi:hypothetical protein
MWDIVTGFSRNSFVGLMDLHPKRPLICVLPKKMTETLTVWPSEKDVSADRFDSSLFRRSMEQLIRRSIHSGNRHKTTISRLLPPSDGLMADPARELPLK